MLRAARGRGLMWSVECGAPTQRLASVLTLGLPNFIAKRLFAHWIALRMLERGFITQTPSHDWNVLRIEPALNVTAEEIDAFIDALEETVADNESFTKFVVDAGGRLISRQLSSRPDAVTR